ncbi:MAG: thimet oligopeptidase [Pseudonocardiales bacterium]|jgi:thimet oligopeptidase|nr:thimet oligopeptidase [Pseudonocardiales bacterium]
MVSTPDPLTFPSSDWPAFVADRADGALARARELLDLLKDGSSRTAQEIVELWNDADVALGNASGLAGVLAQMHPDEAVRTLAEAREQAVARFGTDRGLDRDLFTVVHAVDTASLDADQSRLVERVLRDFRRSGVDKPDDVRDRLRAISEELTLVGQEFSRVIREDVRSVRFKPDRLAGLPQDFIDAHPVDEDGLVTLTTDYPDVIPFRTFAHDADARRELIVEFLNRGWPDNDAALGRLLDLRAEQAHLLGYASWPDFDAEVKMIGTGAAIIEFVDRITALSESAARRDFDILLERRRQDDPQATTLDASEAVYYGELVHKEQFDVDAQQVRRYFDFGRVRAGLLSVTGRLFGVDYVAVANPSTWHDDVVVYDVVRDGERLGRIHLDLHPRAGKFKHAAQFDLVRGIAGRQLAEGVLACNFPRGLMEHADVVTLFHEFGHLVHHVLGGGQRVARFSGVATEWDFVEAPSQLLEEWAWDADVLRTFAIDADGEPIPAALVHRMRAAKEFGKGYFARTQMFYAALSYQLHMQRPDDITRVVRELQATYDLFGYVPDTHFHASFGHLEGYTSAYYTYMWSLVIAKDMFSAFDPADLFDPTVAHRYRDEVLARGGSADAADLVANFLGRPYSFDAFGRWLARAPQAVR